MQNEFHQFLRQFPLIASKNPQLDLLSQEELIELDIQRSELYRKLWNQQKKKFARFSVDTKIRRLVESADRFRDITRAHPVTMDSSIEWPTFGFNCATDGVEDQPLDPSCLAAVQTPEQGNKLKCLFEEIGQQLAFTLSRPCPVFEDRYSVRVEFLDCIAWVALKVERVIKMEVKDAQGDWQLSTFRFNLLKPMHTKSWIDQVLLAWVEAIVKAFPDDAEEACDWLREELGKRFHNQSSLRGVRQQVRHHMSVGPGMIEALLHIKRQAGGRQALMNTDVSEMWPAADFWAELHGKYPGLTLLCYLAAKGEKNGSIRNVSEVRSSYLRHGLSPSGWRYLLKVGEASYRAVIDSGIGQDKAFPMAIGLIEWQSRAGLKEPLPPEMAIAFVNFAAMALLAGMNIAEHVNPRIARVASTYYLKLDQADDRAGFVEKDWLEVLIWLRNAQPEIDKNQWRSGWSCIWRKYAAGSDSRDSAAEWESRVNDISIFGMKVKPLTSSKDLCLEGMKMNHCISSYAKACLDGSYRVFSIRGATADKRIATVGLNFADNAWKLDQIKGRNNRAVSSELESLCNTLAQFYQQADTQYGARRQALASSASNKPAVRREGFFHIKVSAGNCLMSRNSEGGWELARCSEYPISAELRSRLTPGTIGIPACQSCPESAELTIRLRLELPPEFAVYIWDEAQNRDRLLKVD